VPTLTNSVPGRGLATGGGLLTLIGTGFVAGSTVTVGSNACAGATLIAVPGVSGSALQCTIPPGTAGSALVTVTTPGGTSNARTYTYDPVTTLSAIAPTSGPTAGSLVTLTGSGFVSGLTSVTVDGALLCAGVNVVSATQLTCTMPPRTAGAASVVAGTPSGTSSAVSYTYIAPPTLTAIGPAFGPLPGRGVTLTGTGFEAGMTINVDGVAGACTAKVVNGATSATCTMPPHAAGTVNVTVTASGGTSFTVPFEYVALTASAIAPDYGPTTGGTTVTLTGTGFFPGTTVTVDGVADACKPFVPTDTTTATCVMPPHGAGIVNVVLVQGSQTTAPRTYEYNNAPVLKAVTPVAGTPAGGYTVKLDGNSFLSGMTVSVDGVADTCRPVAITSQTSAACTMPPHAVGTVNVAATTPFGTSGTRPFTYTNAPTLTALSPDQGPEPGGNTIQLTGTGFVAGMGVTVGGNACTGVTIVSSSEATCTAPPGTAGAANVVATTGGGSTAPLTYTYDDLPTITQVTPDRGPTAGGTLLTVKGTSFLPGRTGVTVSGYGCQPLVIQDSTTLTCLAPPNLAGPKDLTVATPGGRSLPAVYVYEDTPKLAAVSPNEGPTAGGTTIALTGSSFVAGDTTVTVGGVPCTGLTVTSDSSATCVTPAGVAGTAEVWLSTSGGTDGPGYFTYDNVPKVTSVKPGQGPLGGGTTITVTGSSFIVGATTVTVGGNPCGSVAVSGDKSLTCVTPPGTVGVKDVLATTVGGTSAPGYFTYDNVPTVTGVSPTEGPTAGGTTITVTGSGFVPNVTTVTVGGAACAGVLVANESSLTCTTPAGTSGPAAVVVTTPGGTSAPGHFTYDDLPTLAAVSPTSGLTTGGTVVTLTGTGFTPGMTVNVDGAIGACSGLTVTGTTQASCTMPARPVGAASVTVTTPGGTSNIVPFAYLSITSSPVTIDPTYGPTAGGTTITITGSGLVPGTTVSVDGVAGACQPFVPTAPTATCVMPPHPAGTVNVVVTNASGSSAPLSYTYDNVPFLKSVSPVAGPTAGGYLLKLSGASFGAGMTVSVGGVPGACGSVTVTSQTSATCVMPPGAAGTVNVAVTTPFGTSGTKSFTYTNVPTLSAVTPDQGPVAGGTVITLTGTGFVAGMGVTVGGSACTGVTIVGSDEARCTAPPGAAGAANVVVTTGGGSTAPLPFTYDDLPAITGVAPDRGPTSGGTTITLTGTSFVAGSTSVTVDGQACLALNVQSDTTLTCTTPPGAAGIREIRVTTPGGVSLAAYFTYDDVPKLTAVSPNQGPTAGGTTITLTGTAFVAGSTTVTVGGAACTGLTVTSDSSATCVTPAGAAGTVNVTLTTPGGTSGPVFFTYDNEPKISAVKPGQGPLGGGTTITLTGASFIVGATTVTVGGNPCGSVVVSGDKSLTCVTPPGTVGVKDVLATTAGGTSAPGYFTYDDVPTVTGVSPTAGPSAGGTTITVTGSGFVPNVTTVTVGGNACASVLVASAASLTCVTPPGSSGPAAVVVTTPGGVSAPGSFTYDAPPVLGTLSPSSGSASGPTPITLLGDQFQAGMTVSVNGVAGACTGLVVLSPGLATCTMPPGAVGSVVYITVTTTVGTSNPLPFLYPAASSGACGFASGTAIAFPPAANLCDAGAASAVTAGASGWTWSCAGSGGGTTSSCSAPYQTTATGSGPGHATVSGGAWIFDSVNSAGFIPLTGHPFSPPAPPPPGYDFPHGLFEFVLINGTPGTAATVTITFPATLPAGTVYWKYGPTPTDPTPHWYQMPASIAGNTVTLTITDGGLGDDDLTRNGVIVDQGGPGVPPGAMVAIPTLSEWAMITFALLLTGAALRRLRRHGEVAA
jgi:hypothetical protein